MPSVFPQVSQTPTSGEGIWTCIGTRSGHTDGGDVVMSGETILIMDDRRENIVFLANDILKPQGYNVITAMDGQKGLQKALEEKPDLIITDLKMPKMTGLEVIAALRERGEDIPIILTTFHGSEQIAIEAFRLGVKDYVIKPFDVEQMEQAIEGALAEGRQLRRVRQEKEEPSQDLDRTHDQLKRRVKELQVLSGIGRTVTALRDLDVLSNHIVEAARYLTGAEEGFLLLIDEETGELYMRAAQGMEDKVSRDFHQKVNDSPVGQVVHTGRLIRLGRNQGRRKHEVFTGYLVKSLLNVPLRVQGKVIGVLGVDNLTVDQSFTENDCYLLSTLADYAAIAIENAGVYNAMEQKTKELALLQNQQKKEGQQREEDVHNLAQRLQTQEKQIRQRQQEIESLRQQLHSLASVAEQVAEKLRLQEEEMKTLRESWRNYRKTPTE